MYYKESWLDKLDRKFGRHAVPNLMTILTVCTVAINTTGFYLYYQKIGFTEKAIEAISEKFGTGVTYWTYVGYRLLIGGQGWNCLANYALLFALIPLLNRIRPLNLNIG